MRRGEPPDVVPTADEDELRRIYGSDADEIIAFGRFLRLPVSREGDKLCPPHWIAYARGELSAKDTIAADDKLG